MVVYTQHCPHTEDSYLDCYFLIFASFVSVVSLPSLSLLSFCSGWIFLRLRYFILSETARGGKEGLLAVVCLARAKCFTPPASLGSTCLLGETERFICRNLTDINIIPPALHPCLPHSGSIPSRYSLSCK